VRAGVEDTNALALEFTKIATKNSRPLADPSKIYITGHSIGGHITGAAIEDEAAKTAVNKVKYAGAVPMCGVMGDAELFNQFAAMQVTCAAHGRGLESQFLANLPHGHLGGYGSSTMIFNDSYALNN
jgi:alpha-beta hydrolase superfamily lysophospholipase